MISRNRSSWSSPPGKGGRRRVAAVLAGAAILTTATQAVANESARVDCTAFEITWSGYPAQVVRMLVEVDGSSQLVTFTGPSYVRRWAPLADGLHTVSVTRQGPGFGRRVLLWSGSLSCTTPAPVPVPAPVVAPPTPVVPAVPVVVTPGPIVTPKPKAPPKKAKRTKVRRTTCADIPKGAGRAWYRPIKGRPFACPLPPRLRPAPRQPRVTG